MILLVGSKGVLSKALQEEFSGYSMQIVGSDEASKWANPEGIKVMEDYFNRLNIQPKLIFNAAGILDPQVNDYILQSANFYLPKNLLTFCQKNHTKLVTFGTVMETFDGISQSNPYLYSKRLFYEYIEDKKSSLVNFLHLQIHTWYGGVKLHPHMFLGQMYQALKNRSEFHMTAGNQLREYHHISDDVSAVAHLLEANLDGVFQVNHGKSISLKEIAESTFHYFGLSDLLRIGSVEGPVYDVFESNFTLPKQLQHFVFRNTLEGIAINFEKLLKGSP
jgi:nucleoside-diphosphate-sugar epimerase